MSAERIRVGLVGARGHVGGELLRLLAAHPRLELAFAVSREWQGRPVGEAAPGLLFEALEPGEAVARGAAAVFLALPNGHSAPWVEALSAGSAPPLLIDLSADHRFDPAWVYGLPEHHRARLGGARRIANPGCYATLIQLLLRPFLGELAGPPQCFGVSGHSGAGTAPSPRNDPELLRDNLMPYQLVGHLHEREAASQLGHPLQFFPHVAAFFRGIAMTCNLPLRRPLSAEEAEERLRLAYGQEPLITLTGREIPWIRHVVGRPTAALGGVAVAADPPRLVLVGALDNLLKGAASQAMQNLNAALGWPETLGLEAAP